MLKDTSSWACQTPKQLQKRALWERIVLLLYVEIQLRISRIRRTKGPSSGLAKIAFKTRKKDDTENYFGLEIPRHLARKQFVDSTKVNVDACVTNFPAAYAFLFPGVNSRAELVPSPRANSRNGASRRWFGNDSTF